MLTILFSGIIAEIIGLLFTNQPINFTISLWIGIALALGTSIQMAVTLDCAMELSADDCTKYMIRHNMIRYAVIVLVFGIVLLLGEQLNPLYTFLGIMMLKVGAYLEPFTDKLLSKTKN